MSFKLPWGYFIWGYSPHQVLDLIPSRLFKPLLWNPPFKHSFYTMWFRSVFKQFIFILGNTHTHHLDNISTQLTSYLSLSIFCQESGKSILYSRSLLLYSLPHLNPSKGVSRHTTLLKMLSLSSLILYLISLLNFSPCDWVIPFCD